MATSIKSLLAQNRTKLLFCETHDEISTAIALNTIGVTGQVFHGIWHSGLTQTTHLGVPDTELLTPLQRASLLAKNRVGEWQITEVPHGVAFDADSGGDFADIPELVNVLAVNDVSMVIIEDKMLYEPGKKVNSLAASSASQDQADMYEFAKKLQAFKLAINDAGKDIMVTARIESFTVRKVQGNTRLKAISVQAALQDALVRAKLYRQMGADAIMIHSKSPEPKEVIEFLRRYRADDTTTPLVVVPTTYSKVTRKSLYDAGANVIIYANHLMRAKIKAVGDITEKVLEVNPEFLSKDNELSACLRSRNYGCLLQKLGKRVSLGSEDRELQMYHVIVEALAAENMKRAVEDLLDGDLSGCEADDRIISVLDLLKINAVQLTAIQDLL